MRVQYADYGAGATPERDVPDETVKHFLDWLMTTNMHRLTDNDAWLGLKLRKFRAELAAGASRLEEQARERIAKGIAPPSAGSAEITVAGLLALCDVESTGELQRLVAAGREFDTLTAPGVPSERAT